MNDNEFKNNFIDKLKSKKESISQFENQDFKSLFESLSSEYEEECKTNINLKFKKNLNDSFNKIKKENSNSFDFDKLLENISIESISYNEEVVEKNSIEELKKIEPERVTSPKKIILPIFEHISKINPSNVDEIHPEANLEPELNFLIKSASDSISKEESVKAKLGENYTNLFSDPDSKLIDSDLKKIQNKIKFIEDWLSKISLAGPGGGEVNFKFLDDVNTQNQSNNTFLTYDPITNNYIFNQIYSGQIVNNTTTITSNSYTILSQDYYVGVNCNEPVEIILPNSFSNGRKLIIKDESGYCEENPIYVFGNVDNDPEGFVLKINNGAIQMLYNNGWRII